MMSFSPKLVKGRQNYLNFSKEIVFWHAFHKTLIKTEEFDTLSLSQINSNNVRCKIIRLTEKGTFLKIRLLQDIPDDKYNYN
jgi:hypothetical protein